MFDSQLFQFSFFFSPGVFLFFYFLVFLFFRSLLLFFLSFHQLKRVLFQGLFWEVRCYSNVARWKRTTSFVVWRESIYWMRSKAKRQSQSRWVTTISETIPRLVRSNKVLSPGCLKLTPDPISLMSS